MVGFVELAVSEYEIEKGKYPALDLGGGLSAG